MQTVLPLIALLAAPAAAQIGPLTAAPDSFEVVVRSGNGPEGTPDTAVRHLMGPCAGPFTQPFADRHFRGARTGPPAQILSAPGWGLKSLSSDADAKWVATTSGLLTESALYAVEFEVPAGFIAKAKLDFHYGVDDYLGTGANAGLYINGQQVPGSSPGPVGSWSSESLLSGLEVTSLLRPGKNWLYVNATNGACSWWGGLIFSARFTINPAFPDGCDTAAQAFLGDNGGSTVGFTTSFQTATCGLSDDRWHWYVPETSGALGVRLTKQGPAADGFLPGMAIFTGTCSSLSAPTCAFVGSSFSGAFTQTSVPVNVGEPVLIAVGGQNGTSGLYELRLEPPSSQAVDPSTGSSYTLVNTPMDFASARANAVAMGGTLAAITTAAEQAFVEQNVLQGGDAWLGLTDEGVEGTWVWDTGEPFGGFTNWSPGEPNDASGCGEDYGGMFGTGLWNDWPQTPPQCAHYEMRSIVEFPPSTNPATVLDVFGACGPEYVPQLWSDVHRIGATTQFGVFDAPPETSGLLFNSAPPAGPAAIGDCLLFLDVLSAQLVAAFVTNEYGSANIPFAIPNDPLLLGVLETWQAQMVLPPTEPLSYTNGLLIQIGS